MRRTSHGFNDYRNFVGGGGNSLEAAVFDSAVLSLRPSPLAPHRVWPAPTAFICNRNAYAVGNCYQRQATLGQVFEKDKSFKSRRYGDYTGAIGAHSYPHEALFIVKSKGRDASIC